MKMKWEYLENEYLENSGTSHTWEFYGLLQLLKVFGSPGCGDIWPEGVVQGVMSAHLVCCVRQGCSEEFLMGTGSSHANRNPGHWGKGSVQGVPVAGRFLVRLPSLGWSQRNPCRQEGVGENDEHGECLMCVLPARVLCMVLLEIFAICNSLNLFQRLEMLVYKWLIKTNVTGKGTALYSLVVFVCV